MSLLNWLTPKPAPQPQPQPLPAGARQPALQPADTRKADRLAQRELLYPIVRESMVRAGILSSHYKFKVLSVDTQGRRFLVMVDLSPEIVEDSSQLSQVEALIAQQAMARHQFEVAGTYWRINDALQRARQTPAAPGNPALGETQHGDLV